MKEFCVVLPLLFARLEQLRQVMKKHGLATDHEPVSYSHMHWEWSLGRGHLELSLEVNLEHEYVEWAVSPISDGTAGILIATWQIEDLPEDCWRLISTATKKAMHAPELRLVDQLRTRHILAQKPHAERRANCDDALVAFDETCALLATLPPEETDDADEADTA